MIERYNNEVPALLRMLGAWRINRDSIDFKWGYFAPRFGFELVVNRGGYFDQQYSLDIAFVWGKFNIKLPFTTKLEEGCDMPRYGLEIHSDTFWIYTGGDYKDGQTQNGWVTWYLPFFSWEFDGHWIKDVNQEWAKIESGGWNFKKEGKAYQETHPYTYVLRSGKVQKRNATCTIEKRKWHRKWFPFLTKTCVDLDIEFDNETGERTGSWKGGTLGCMYEMLPDDTIETCLRRMEVEREFT